MAALQGSSPVGAAASAPLVCALSILLTGAAAQGDASGETLAPATHSPDVTRMPATHPPPTPQPPTPVPPTPPPPTPAPQTRAPATHAPDTEAPATRAPATHSPDTVAPTRAPATQSPDTLAPATGVPATGVPATGTPATGVPATTAPATEVPATDVPATDVPATSVPATTAPATEVPATDVPATAVPAVETAMPPTPGPPAPGPAVPPATPVPGATIDEGGDDGVNVTETTPTPPTSAPPTPAPPTPAPPTPAPPTPAPKVHTDAPQPTPAPPSTPVPPAGVPTPPPTPTPPMDATEIQNEDGSLRMIPYFGGRLVGAREGVCDDTGLTTIQASLERAAALGLGSCKAYNAEAPPCTTYLTLNRTVVAGDTTQWDAARVVGDGVGEYPVPSPTDVGCIWRRCEGGGQQRACTGGAGITSASAPPLEGPVFRAAAGDFPSLAFPIDLAAVVTGARSDPLDDASQRFISLVDLTKTRGRGAGALQAGGDATSTPSSVVDHPDDAILFALGLAPGGYLMCRYQNLYAYAPRSLFPVTTDEEAGTAGNVLKDVAARCRVEVVGGTSTAPERVKLTLHQDGLQVGVALSRGDTTAAAGVVEYTPPATGVRMELGGGGFTGTITSSAVAVNRDSMTARGGVDPDAPTPPEDIGYTKNDAVGKVLRSGATACPTGFIPPPTAAVCTAVARGLQLVYNTAVPNVDPANQTAHADTPVSRLYFPDHSPEGCRFRVEPPLQGVWFTGAIALPEGTPAPETKPSSALDWILCAAEGLQGVDECAGGGSGGGPVPDDQSDEFKYSAGFGILLAVIGGLCVVASYARYGYARGGAGGYSLFGGSKADGEGGLPPVPADAEAVAGAPVVMSPAVAAMSPGATRGEPSFADVASPATAQGAAMGSPGARRGLCIHGALMDCCELCGQPEDDVELSSMGLPPPPKVGGGGIGFS